VWSRSCPEGEKVVLVYYSALVALSFWKCIPLRTMGLHRFLCLCVFSNAQNRHGFVGLASLPVLFYACYKAVLRIKMTSDDPLGGVERNYGTNFGFL